ncbi:MAG: LicD family protein [Bacteroidales bacterium]|nr:LicD family protein [Bacteroidales bacterium]
MKKSLGIEEIRQIQLRMMDEVDSFCTANNINYSLSGGSLLGAVRHKGFIPWDDDVDLLMPRPDYERFLSLFNKSHEDIKALNYRVDSNFPRPFTKITDMNTRIVARNGISCYGVFLDLFPVDGQPDSEEETRVYVNRYRSLNKKFYKRAPIYRMTSNPLIMLKTIIRTRFYPPREETYAQIRDLLGSYPFESSNFAGAVTGGSGMGTHIPSSVYHEFIRREFEGRTYSTVKDADTYLKRMYGDYMKLPPLSEQRTHHFGKVYKLL